MRPTPCTRVGLDQAFLRRAADLDELDAARCDAVLERQDSAAVLRRLERANQLVVSAEGSLHRYHHLLREALLDELTVREPQQVPVLHARAARWCAARGDIDGAVRHATAGGHTDLVSSHIWSAATRALGSGYPDVLGRWLRWVDDAAVDADPWLTLAAAFLEMELRNQLDPACGCAPRPTPGATGRPLPPPTSTPPRWPRWSASWAAGGSAAPTPSAPPPRRPFCRTPGGARRPCSSRGSARPSSGSRTSPATTSRSACGSPRPSGWPCSRPTRSPGSGWPRACAATGTLLERADSVCRAGRLHRLATGAHALSAQALWLAVSDRRAEAREALTTARRLTALTTDITPWFRLYGPLLQARTAMLLGDLPTARQLCREAKAHFTPDLTGTLVEDLARDVDGALSRLPATAGTTEALTAAEIRVLQYLPSRLTLPQIGEHLFVSRNTVKSHAVSICRKLSVRSQDEAVARAHDLGSIEPLSLG